MIPKLAAGLAFIIFFSSCDAPRYMYNPTAHNVPVLVKKGDSKVAAYYSSNLSDGIVEDKSSHATRNSSHGLDVQGAVAITNSIALQASYYNRSERNGSDENSSDHAVIRYKRNLAEIGIGYFKSMHRRNKILFQVFGGIGKGAFSFTDNGIDVNNVPYRRSHQADVIKLYLQPAFVFRIRENFAMSISSRMSFINYRNIKTDYTQQEQESYLLNDLPYGTRTFWEPAFTNSFGFKKLEGVKFEYQLSTALLSSDRQIDYRSFNFALGILLDPAKIFQAHTTD